jgi:hypothetical protein
MEYKLKVVDYSKNNSKHKAASKYRIDRKRVKEWCKEEKTLRNFWFLTNFEIY